MIHSHGTFTFDVRHNLWHYKNKASDGGDGRKDKRVSRELQGEVRDLKQG